MWRVLTQLPSLISECIGHLRTVSYLTQQQLLLAQETNLLLRELIVKVTTQPAETPVAVRIEQSFATEPVQPPLVDLTRKSQPRDRPRKILTEHDISHQTRSSMAEEQFRQESLRRYPHRKDEQLPTSPTATPTPATRPFGGPPV